MANYETSKNTYINTHTHRHSTIMQTKKQMLPLAFQGEALKEIFPFEMFL